MYILIFFRYNVTLITFLYLNDWVTQLSSYYDQFLDHLSSMSLMGNSIDLSFENQAILPAYS